MATNTNPIFVLTPTTDGTTITSAQTTVAQVITTGKSTEGTRVDCIIVTSSSSTSQILRFDIYNNSTSTSYHIGDVTLVTNAGYSGAAARGRSSDTLPDPGLPSRPFWLLLESGHDGYDLLRDVYDHGLGWDVCLSPSTASPVSTQLAYSSKIQAHPNIWEYWRLTESTGTTFAGMIRGSVLTISGASYTLAQPGPCQGGRPPAAHEAPGRPV